MKRGDALKEGIKQERRSEHRELILGCIASMSGRHLSAEQVYEEVRKLHPGIGVATVYRNLKQLEDSGAVTRTSLAGETALYEASSPAKLHMHHHLVCVSCGNVEDLDADLLEELERHVEQKRGFKVQDHRLQVFGICSDCDKNISK